MNVYDEIKDLYDFDKTEMNGKPFTVQYLQTSRCKKYKTAFSGLKWCDYQRKYTEKAARQNGWYEYHVAEKGKELEYTPGKRKNRKRNKNYGVKYPEYKSEYSKYFKPEDCNFKF